MRRIAIVFTLIAALVTGFQFNLHASGSAKPEAGEELQHLQKMIAERGLHWTAKMTPMMNIPLEERHKRLDLVIPEEIRQRFEQLNRLPAPALLNPQDIFDWRAMNGVTPVKDQSNCGACWDFAATGAFESAYLIGQGVVPDFSEQQVLSCNTGGGNCIIGMMDDAYDLFMSYGAVDESCMPYQASSGVPCTQDQCSVIAHLSGYEQIPNNVNAIKNAVMQSPVSTAMTAYDDFVGYGGGCYEHADIQPLNHAVVIVGWDDEVCGGEGAWIVKNEWGVDWGDSGYCYIKYNSSGIGNYTERPIYVPVGPPLFSFNPDSINVRLVSNAIMYQTLHFRNTGHSDLLYSIQAPGSPAWMSVDPAAGQIPRNDSTIIYVTLRSDTLPPGTYGSVLEVSTNDPDHEAETIPVTMNVFRVPSSSAVFDSSTFTPADSGVYWVVCALLDVDSCLDLATVNTFANSISVFFNDCYGTFTPGGDYEVGQNPRTIFAADLDGDNVVDLATANSGSNDISVLINDGVGGFPSVPDSYSSGGSSWGIFCGDYDNDGDMDIAVTTGDSGTIAIFMNDGDGTFPVLPSQILSAEGGAFGIYAADLDLDHYLDLAITSGDVRSVKIFINNGDGTFPPVPTGSYSSEGSSWGIFCADLNGDGYPDLAVTNPDVESVVVLLNNGDGTFPPTLNGSYDTPGSAWGIFCADYDGDSDVDIAASNSDSGTVSIFRNDGHGDFPPPQPIASYETNGSAWGIFAADLNGDGILDIAVANTETDGVTELWNGPYQCQYVPGDVNGTPPFNGIDITYSVNYLKGIGAAPPVSCDCPPNGHLFVAGDANGSCLFNGIDVSYGVNYLKGLGSAPQGCPDCPPAVEPLRAKLLESRAKSKMDESR